MKRNGYFHRASQAFPPSMKNKNGRAPLVSCCTLVLQYFSRRVASKKRQDQHGQVKTAMIIAPERKSMVEPNPMAHLLQRLEIYGRAKRRITSRWYWSE